MYWENAVLMQALINVPEGQINPYHNYSHETALFSVITDLRQEIPSCLEHKGLLDSVIVSRNA
jgi:hypothetical protein